MSDRVYIQEGVEREGSTSWNETMAGAAYLQGIILVGILQKVGPVTLDEGWFDRAEQAVAYTDAIKGKTFGDGIRAYAVPRSDVSLPMWEPKVT